jgi:hypothetical protein
VIVLKRTVDLQIRHIPRGITRIYFSPRVPMDWVPGTSSRGGSGRFHTPPEHPVPRFGVRMRLICSIVTWLTSPHEQCMAFRRNWDILPEQPPLFDAESRRRRWFGRYGRTVDDPQRFICVSLRTWPDLTRGIRHSNHPRSTISPGSNSWIPRLPTMY